MARAQCNVSVTVGQPALSETIHSWFSLLTCVRFKTPISVDRNQVGAFRMACFPLLLLHSSRRGTPPASRRQLGTRQYLDRLPRAQCWSKPAFSTKAMLHAHSFFSYCPVEKIKSTSAHRCLKSFCSCVAQLHNSYTPSVQS